METAKKVTRPWPLLFFSLLSLSIMGYILFSFPPGNSFSLGSVNISYLIIFFVLLFVCLYGLVAFFLKSALQGILVALVVIAFLLFRLFNLTNPFFSILLLIVFFCAEGVLWRKK